MKLLAVMALVAGQAWAQAARPYMITTYAGKGPVVFSQEGASPTSAQLMRPERVAADLAGNLYVSDSYYHRVFKVSPVGNITTLAGTGTAGSGGDGGSARSAPLNSPTGVAVNAAGYVYIADTGNHRVRVVSPAGTIATLAGTGTAGYGGDRGPAAQATLSGPTGLALDAAGNLYIADTGNHAVRRADSAGTLTTVAGTGEAGSSGDRGPAASAKLNAPAGVALDGAGNLYIADSGNHKVRRVAAAGATIATVAGTGTAAFAGDGAAAVNASLFSPQDLAIDSRTNVYITDLGNRRVRKIAPDGTIISAAGTGVTGDAGDGDYTYNAQFVAPTGLALDSSYNLYLVDRMARRVRRMFTGTIYTAVGVGAVRSTGDNGKATAAQLVSPTGVTLDAYKNLYVADHDDNRVRKIVSDGTITSYSGTGVYGYSPDLTPAPTALLANPRSVAVDAAFLIYIGDAYKLLRADQGRLVSAIAGTGVDGDTGDNGPGTQAALGNDPRVVLDAAGNLYFSDPDHHRVRRLSTAGVVTTVAGTGVAGYGGDGGPASAAKLNAPSGMALDSKGNLYVADAGNQRVRRIGTDGVITTVASQLATPSAVAVDAAGNLYIAERASSTIRKVTTDGAVSIIAGTGTAGFGGDGGPATRAQLNGPEALAVDASGILYVADTGNARVRRLEPAQIFSTSIVNAASYAGAPVAPGEVVTIFGVEFGPPSLATLSLTAAGAVDTTVAGTRVFFDNVAAPVLYATRGQVSAIVPYALAGKTTTLVRVETQGQPTNIVPVAVAPSAPGLFTQTASGKGQGAILNQDGTLNSASNAAARGSIVQLFGTGEGQTTPGGVDGRVVRTGALPRPTQTATATVGGVAATVQYAGASYGMVGGVVQINVRIPDTVTPGAAVPIVVKVGANSSQDGVTVAVK